jgi:hypothetical protein
MKRPEVIWIKPVAHRNKRMGMELHLPEWLCRAYRLKDHDGLMSGRIMVRIQEKPRSMLETNRTYRKKRNHRYYLENWSGKIHRELKREREAATNPPKGAVNGGK